jgi:hypothetical protein
MQITVKYAIVSMMLVLMLATAGAAQDPGWPRQRTVDGNVLVMYQPQVDDWKNFTELECRMAISLTPAGGKSVVGVMVLKGDTQVDNEEKMVLVTNLRIKNTNFPSLDPARAAQMDQMLRTFLPPVVSVSLQRLVAYIPKKESVPGVQLKNDPPMIFVSYKPAILLDVDGQPVRAPIKNTDLEYVVNTHWPLFFDKSKSEYFLLAGENWLHSSNLDGPWSIAKKLPNDMDKVVNDPQWEELIKFIPPAPAKPDAIPTVL